MQAPEVDLRGAEHGRDGRAPALEGVLVLVADRRDQPSATVAVAPLGRQGRSAGPAVSAVAALVPEAQPERGVRQFRADLDPATAEAGQRVLIEEPGVEVGVAAAAAAMVVPTELVVVAELQSEVTGGPSRADLAGALLDPLPGADGRRGAEELGSCSSLVAVLAPEHLVG